MPVLQPAEIWQRTGRYGIDELFKLKDRKGTDMVLGMTHEDVLTWHMSQTLRSYKELPLIVYHQQTKERDEARPRAGLLRTREFIMKDSYSFDLDLRGARRQLSEALRRLRADLRPGRAAVLRRRVRRRDDGWRRRARVHGAVRGGRERRRARARLRRQRRGAPAPIRSRSSCRRGAGRARADPHAGADDRRAGGRRARRARGRAAEGVPGRHRVARNAHGRRPRRSPRQRDQARQRARRAGPPGAARGDRRAGRPARLHRARRREASR